MTETDCSALCPRQRWYLGMVLTEMFMKKADQTSRASRKKLLGAEHKLDTNSQTLFLRFSCPKQKWDKQQREMDIERYFLTKREEVVIHSTLGCLLALNCHMNCSKMTFRCHNSKIQRTMFGKVSNLRKIIYMFCMLSTDYYFKKLQRH